MRTTKSDWRPRVIRGNKPGTIVATYLGYVQRQGWPPSVTICCRTSEIIESNVPVGGYEARRLAKAARKHLAGVEVV